MSECVTHHHACDCREADFAAILAELEGHCEACAAPFRSALGVREDEERTMSTHAEAAAIQDQARAIAMQAEAIASATVVGPLSAAARRLLSNAETLVAWTEDDHE